MLVGFFPPECGWERSTSNAFDYSSTQKVEEITLSAVQTVYTT